jgi:hypothetical protein
MAMLMSRTAMVRDFATRKGKKCQLSPRRLPTVSSLPFLENAKGKLNGHEPFFAMAQRTPRECNWRNQYKKENLWDGRGFSGTSTADIKAVVGAAIGSEGLPGYREVVAGRDQTQF